MSKNTVIAPDEARSLTLAAEAGGASAGIVSRTLVQTPELRVILFSFAAGQELTPHASTRRALVQVLSGECEFFHSEAWHRLKAGDFLHMPPGHVHAVRGEEAFTMLLTLGAEAAGGRRKNFP